MNHPWGIPPTGPGTVPFTTRADPQQLIKPGFASLRDHNGPIADSATTSFAHRDMRVWTVEIMKIPASHHLVSHDQKSRFLSRLQSHGVVPLGIISRKLTDAKNCVLNFANMPLDLYEMLVSDARGTSASPNQGELVLLAVQTVTPESMRPLRPFEQETEVPTRQLYGRLDRARLRVSIFPTWQQVDAALLHCCDTQSLPLNSYIDEFGLPHNLGTFDRAALAGYASRQTGPDTPAAQAAAETEENISLHDLLYPEIRGREHRAIEL